MNGIFDFGAGDGVSARRAKHRIIPEQVIFVFFKSSYIKIMSEFFFLFYLLFFENQYIFLENFESMCYMHVVNLINCNLI